MLPGRGQPSARGRGAGRGQGPALGTPGGGGGGASPAVPSVACRWFLAWPASSSHRPFAPLTPPYQYTPSLGYQRASTLDSGLGAGSNQPLPAARDCPAPAPQPLSASSHPPLSLPSGRPPHTASARAPTAASRSSQSRAALAQGRPSSRGRRSGGAGASLLPWPLALESHSRSPRGSGPAGKWAPRATGRTTALRTTR